MAESFGQEEPLTVRLSGLLTEYPPGDSTLKELLQNADDAGARVVVRVSCEAYNLLSDVRHRHYLARERTPL